MLGGPLGILLVIAATTAPAVAPAPAEAPSEDTLRSITERGRTVALAIDAIAKARAKLERQGAAIAAPDGVIAYLERDLWHVVFLKDPEADTVPGMPRRGTMVLAETDYAAAADDVGDLRVMTPPRAATSTMVSNLRAVQNAEREARDRTGPESAFDVAAVREKDGTFTIYLLRKDETGKSARFGGDLVVRVMASGRQVASVETGHSAATDVPLAARASGQPTLHTHASGDLPTPGDVALVRLHPALAPHLVLTPRSMFRIDAEGAITYLGPNPVPVAPQAAKGS